MSINSETSLYCLVGNPVSKSLSPDIHNKVFELEDINSIYMTFNIKSEELKSFMSSIKTLNIKGVNVTIPHKIDIIKYLDEVDEYAAKLNAVNTIKNENGKLKGYNTDGLGFIKALKDRNIELKEKKCLVIGAGGASRAICHILASNKIKQLTIANRTKEKAVKLKEELKVFYKDIIIKTYDYNSAEIYTENNDIYINTTNVGMYPNEEQSPIEVEKIKNKAVFYDVVYKPLQTKFLKDAKLNKHETIQGIEMLLNQALESQRIWNDVELEAKEYEALKKEIIKRAK